MAQEIILLQRNFDRDIQKLIQAEATQKNWMWRGFEENDFVARELEDGLRMTENLLPKPLREHIQYVIDPLTFQISFYLSIGYDE